MPSSRRSFGLLVVAASLVAGCARTPTPPAHPPATATIRLADPDHPSPEHLGPDREIGPIGFVFERSPGFVRATLEVAGTSENPGPFLHDALFLAKGGGRLSFVIRKPWPGHERGRVSIRCEGGDEDSTIDYEPELWFGRPVTGFGFVTTVGSQPRDVREGEEIELARIEASTAAPPGPIRVTFKIAFASGPIKPRVKAGVRPPR